MHAEVLRRKDGGLRLGYGRVVGISTWRGETERAETAASWLKNLCQ